MSKITNGGLIRSDTGCFSCMVTVGVRGLRASCLRTVTVVVPCAHTYSTPALTRNTRNIVV